MQFSERLWKLWGIPAHPKRVLPVWIVQMSLTLFMLYGQVSTVLATQQPDPQYCHPISSGSCSLASLISSSCPWSAMWLLR